MQLPDGIYSYVGISIWLKVNCILHVNASMLSISRRHAVFFNSPQLVLQNQQVSERSELVNPENLISNYFILFIFIGILNFDFYFLSVVSIITLYYPGNSKRETIWKINLVLAISFFN